MEIIQNMFNHEVDLIGVFSVELLLIGAEDVVKEVDNAFSELPAFVTVLKEPKEGSQWEKGLALGLSGHVVSIR